MTYEFYTAVFITILITLLTQATQVSVARSRKKFSISLPKVTGHEEFERFHRAHTDQIEQNVFFLPILWISSFLVSWVLILPFGLSWIIFRALYIRGFVTENKKMRDYSNTGYLISQIALFLLVFVSFGIGLFGITF